MNGNDLTRELQNTFPFAPELVKAAPDAISLIADALAGLNKGNDPQLLAETRSVLLQLKKNIGDSHVIGLEIIKRRSNTPEEHATQRDAGFYDGITVYVELDKGEAAALTIKSSDDHPRIVRAHFGTKAYPYTLHSGWIINLHAPDGEGKYWKSGISLHSMLGYVHGFLGTKVGEPIIVKLPKPPAAETQKKPDRSRAATARP
ncbi:MAG: hypothetical protein PHY92_09350 [Alphaproteobacteria bacterium]|nr:hypothetical protein [Alphaproteobacteria bacterium]